VLFVLKRRLPKWKLDVVHRFVRQSKGLHCGLAWSQETFISVFHWIRTTGELWLELALKDCCLGLASSLVISLSAGKMFVMQSQVQLQCQLPLQLHRPLRVRPLRVRPLRVQPLRVQPLRVQPLRVQPLRVQPLRVRPLKVQPLLNHQRLLPRKPQLKNLQKRLL